MRLPGGIGLAARDAEDGFDDDDYWFGDGRDGGGNSGGDDGGIGDGGEGAAAAPDESAGSAAPEAAVAAAMEQGPQQQPRSGAQGTGPAGFVKVMLIVAPPGKEASCRNVDVEGAIMVRSCRSEVLIELIDSRRAYHTSEPGCRTVGWAEASNAVRPGPHGVEWIPDC